MKLLLFMLSLTALSAFADAGTCQTEIPLSTSTPAGRHLNVTCGGSAVYVPASSRVSRATVVGRDVNGQEYRATINVTCNRAPCSMAQIHNRQFDQDTALYAFAGTNGSVPPITYWNVTDVSFSNPAAVRVSSEPNGTGTVRALSASADGADVTRVNLPAWSGGVVSVSDDSSAGSLPPASAARSPVVPSGTVAAAPVPVAAPEEEFSDCTYLSPSAAIPETASREETASDRESVALFSLPQTSSSSCTASKACSGRVYCRSSVAGVYGVTVAFCKVSGEDQCPSATTCANAKDFERAPATSVPTTPSTRPTGSTAQ